MLTIGPALSIGVPRGRRHVAIGLRNPAPPCGYHMRVRGNGSSASDVERYGMSARPTHGQAHDLQLDEPKVETHWSGEWR